MKKTVVKTYDKNSKTFGREVLMVIPKNLKPEMADLFATRVQVQAMHWTKCEANEQIGKILKDNPEFASEVDMEALTEEELKVYAKYLDNTAIVEAYDNYSFSDEEKEALEHVAEPDTMVWFYASFVSNNAGIAMDGFKSIYEDCRYLFRTYVLTDTTDAMNTDKVFKELRKKIVGFYNSKFKLEEDTDLFNAKGSSIAKVSASFVKLLVSDFKVPARLNGKTGKAELGGYRQEKTCRKIFRTYILAKVQNLSLDEARQEIDSVIQKEVTKAEKEAMKDSQPKEESEA